MGPDERSLQAYTTINLFLQTFIDHGFKDLDYTVRDQMLLESLVGLAPVTTDGRGVFTKDNGHSFDQCLFYGHEVS